MTADSSQSEAGRTAKSSARRHWVWRLLREGLILLALIGLVGLWQARDLVSSGEKAPPVSGTLLDGAALPDQESDRRSSLIYFFAPWCGVCRLSAGNLVWVAKLLGGDESRVQAVALDYESPAGVKEFVVDAGIESIPVVLGDEATQDGYRISAYPTFYVLDGQGNVRSVGVGYSTVIGMAARLWLAELMD